jgi:hypothetical protein
MGSVSEDIALQEMEIRADHLLKFDLEAQAIQMTAATS